MHVSETKIRVRYGETDKMDFVYHGNYPTYYHAARNDFFREIGLSEKEIEEMGIILPVIDVKMQYFTPAFYDDILTVKTYLKKLSGVKLCFTYDIFNQNDELINKGETTLTFVNNETRKPTRPPKELSEKLSKFM